MVNLVIFICFLWLLSRDEINVIKNRNKQFTVSNCFELLLFVELVVIKRKEDSERLLPTYPVRSDNYTDEKRFTYTKKKKDNIWTDADNIKYTRDALPLKTMCIVRGKKEKRRTQTDSNSFYYRILFAGRVRFSVQAYGCLCEWKCVKYVVVHRIHCHRIEIVN